MVRYVALQPIDAGSVRAYNPGDPVHPDNVETQGYVVGEQVADADSDEAQARLRELGILPPADGDTADTAADVEGAEPAPGAPLDPAQGTVEEVNDWLDQHPDRAADVLAAERDGKARAGILHGRHGAPPDVAEA